MPDASGFQTTAPPRRPRVVIIDDSVSVCKAVERMISPRGAEVVAIHSGEEALARLEQEAPHLVICDLVLPDLEGAAVCRFVRESTVLRRVPVLAITGLASDEARRSALAAGADAVLKKPFRSEVLLADVDALLAGARDSLREPAPPPEPPGPVKQVLGQMETLDGLVAGGWWLATGARGRWRARAGRPATDPETMLARLRSFAAPLGIEQPSIALIEGEGRELVLVAHRDRRGVVYLQLGPTAVLGKARFLARKFLHHLDRLELPSPSPGDGAEPEAERGPNSNQRS